MTEIRGMRLRLATVAGLAFALGALVALTRSPEGQFQTGLSREKFWLSKLKAPPAYDLVLAGDSRALCDLDPAVFEKEMASERVLNFGFNYVALTPAYLDAVASKLDPASRNRSILIAVTPRSLTPLNARVSGYVEEQRRKWDERFFNWHLNAVNLGTRPLSLASLVTFFHRGPVGFKDFFPNGFMAVSLRPPNSRTDLKVYQRIFVNNQVSAAMSEGFMRKVEELSRAGVKVYGIRLPVSPEILECEETLSGFSEGDYVSRFEASGGRWLQSPAGSYVFCDGSHLDASSVEPFSLKLAGAISRDARP